MPPVPALGKTRGLKGPGPNNRVIRKTHRGDGVISLAVKVGRLDVEGDLSIADLTDSLPVDLGIVPARDGEAGFGGWCWRSAGR